MRDGRTKRYECTRLYTGAGMAQYCGALASHQCGTCSIPPGAICGLSLLAALALLQGFFSVLCGFKPPQKPTLQIPIRPGYKTNMKSSLGGIGFLSKCCNLFIISFILRFEKPSKQAKQFQVILEILRKVHQFIRS